MIDDTELERLAGVRPRLGYNEIVQQPRLRKAVRVYLDRFLAVYDDEPFLVRLLIRGWAHRARPVRHGARRRA